MSVTGLLSSALVTVLDCRQMLCCLIKPQNIVYPGTGIDIDMVKASSDNTAMATGFTLQGGGLIFFTVCVK